jgi:hypothetical protein
MAVGHEEQQAASWILHTRGQSGRHSSTISRLELCPTMDENIRITILAFTIKNRPPSPGAVAVQPPGTPSFNTEDGSSIEVYVTKNKLQKSIARNGFSRGCIQSNLYYHNRLPILLLTMFKFC